MLSSVHSQKQLPRGPLAQVRSKRTSDHIITGRLFETDKYLSKKLVDIEHPSLRYLENKSAIIKRKFKKSS